MRKINRGQIIVGKLHASSANEVFMVKGISELKSGDRKAWLLKWTPQDELGNPNGLDAEYTVTFKQGDLPKDWKVLDFWDPNAMLARVARVIEIGRKGHTDDDLALKCLQAMFAGEAHE